MVDRAGRSPSPARSPPSCLRSPPPTSRADESPPSAHYEEAQQLYATGDYDEAIAEYERGLSAQAAPERPLQHRAGLRAAARLRAVGGVVRALSRRGAARTRSSAPIVENRLRILRNLPARISVTTIPEHVHAAIVDAGGKRQEADTPALFKMPAGAYSIELVAAGLGGASATTSPSSSASRTSINTGSSARRRRCAIFTRPRGARVFIDERLVGETPFAGTLDVGKHKLLLEHRDYPWHREDLDRAAGRAGPARGDADAADSQRPHRARHRRHGRSAAPPARCWSRRSSATRLLRQLGPGLLVYLLVVGRRHRRRLSRLVPRHARRHQGRLQLAHDRRRGVGHLVRHVARRSGSACRRATSTGSPSPAAASAWPPAFWSRARPTSPPATPRSSTPAARGARRRARCLAQAIFRNPSSSQFGWFILGGTTAGVLTGSLLAWKLELSRGHVGLIDVGGLAGTGLGFALGYVIGVNSRRRGQHPGRRPLRARRHGARPARRRHVDPQVQGRRPARRGAHHTTSTAAGPSACPRSPSSRRSRPKATPRASRSPSPRVRGESAEAFTSLKLVRRTM